MGKKMNKAAFRVFVAVIVVIAAFFAAQRDCAAGQSSSDDQDAPKAKCTCTVLPNAVTKVTDGVAEKGHLVGCRGRSYTCLNFNGRYECRDNAGTTVIPFDFPMTEHTKFCSLLCATPECGDGEWTKR
jgi:hypothetical protein